MSLFSDTYIQHRIGEDTKCESYCPVAEFCPHGSKRQEVLE